MLRNFGVKGKIKNDLRVYLVAYTFSAKLHVLLALDHNQWLFVLVQYKRNQKHQNNMLEYSYALLHV